MDFLQSDAAKKIGKGLLTVGGAALERKRTKNALEAGLDERAASATKQGEEGKKAYEKMLESLRDRPAVTQASEDAIQGQKEAAEALLAAGDKRAQEQRSDVVSALQSGDPRAAATMLDTLDKLGGQEDAARAQALATKVGADAKRAGLVEKEKDYQSALDQMLMERGATAMDEAERRRLDIIEEKEGAGPAATGAGMETGIALAQLLKDFKPGNPGDTEEGEKGLKIKYEDGGYMADKGFKTKGEFNHKTNKKAVIDEENGEKEAELTGGEVVFNPEQTGKMEDFVKKGDAKGLLKFMKDLLSKPQFQD